MARLTDISSVFRTDAERFSRFTIYLQTITYLDGREVTLNLQFQQKWVNRPEAQNTGNLGHSNCNPGNVDNVNHNTPYPNSNENHSKSNLQTSTLPIYAPTTEPATDEPVHQSGGEGLIDVRIGVD